MTLKPETPPKTEPKTDPVEIAVLEDLFYIGYITSKKITIYEDNEKGTKIDAVFRTLMPAEFRDIFEIVGKYDTFQAQEITNHIETLSRAIKTINDMPLVLDTKEKEEFKNKYDREPSPLDQAREILTNKIHSVQVVDALFDAYQKFYDDIKTQFDELKKK